MAPVPVHVGAAPGAKHSPYWGTGLVSSPGQLTAGATHGSSPPRRLHWVLLGRQLHHPGTLHSGAPLFVPGVVGKILSEELCLLQGFTKCPGGTFSRGPGGGQGLGRTLHGRSGARHGGGHVGPGLLQQIPAHRGLKHPRLPAGSRAGVRDRGLCGPPLRRLWGGAFLPFWRPGDCRHPCCSLAGGCIPPVSASVSRGLLPCLHPHMTA